MSDSKKFEYSTVPLLSHATKQILDSWGSDAVSYTHLTLPTSDLV